MTIILKFTEAFDDKFYIQLVNIIEKTTRIFKTDSLFLLVFNKHVWFNTNKSIKIQKIEIQFVLYKNRYPQYQQSQRVPPTLFQSIRISFWPMLVQEGEKGGKWEIERKKWQIRNSFNRIMMPLNCRLIYLFLTMKERHVLWFGPQRKVNK